MKIFFTHSQKSVRLSADALITFISLYANLSYERLLLRSALYRRCSELVLQCVQILSQAIVRKHFKYCES